LKEINRDFTKRIKENAVPFGTVLTLPAQERNELWCVVTIESTKEKLAFGLRFVSKFSICDPTVKSLPKTIAKRVVDAYTRDGVFNISSRRLFTRPYCRRNFADLEVGPKLWKTKDYALASNFMWSCTMALNGLIQKECPSDWTT
jgi:NADP-dependent alcohol dehydrogenase